MTVSQLPLTRNFSLFVGGTFNQSFHWKAGGIDVDLTDWDAWLTYGIDLDTPLGEFSVESGTITLTADGRIQILLTDEQTLELGNSLRAFESTSAKAPKVSRGVTEVLYQLSLEDDNGEITPLMSGVLYIQYLLKRPPKTVEVDLTGEEIGSGEDELAAPAPEPLVDVIVTTLETASTTVSDEVGGYLSGDPLITGGSFFADSEFVSMSTTAGSAEVLLKGVSLSELNAGMMIWSNGTDPFPTGGTVVSWVTSP